MILQNYRDISPFFHPLQKLFRGQKRLNKKHKLYVFLTETKGFLSCNLQTYSMFKNKKANFKNNLI